MLPLDADSLMDGETILRLVRVMQKNPRLGILQTMIAGTPAKSLFARLFQFGMRHGMRSYSLGSSWWQGDCGPFWGHNALVRIAPFLEHCRLKDLPGEPPFGGTILSHDQVEGALMRGGGYEVRVLPEEAGSWEDNPPTLAEFLRRNARWCNGNLQYLKLWNMPGLLPASRFHFALALELFFSQAGLLAFVVLAALLAAVWPADVEFPKASAVALYAVWILMAFSPKFFAIADTLVQSARRFGGGARLLAGALLETVFTILIAPVVCVASTLTMIGLLFGRTAGWDGQRRDDYRVEWEDAARSFWPQTALGAALLLLLAVTAPGAIIWFSPFLAGLLLAIPFAVLTSSPALGELAARWKLCAVPEEFDTPPEIAKLQRAGAR
jgi:membrane glycosyltransferase